MVNSFDHLNILRKRLIGLLVLFKTFEILEKSHSVLAMDILLTFFNSVCLITRRVYIYVCVCLKDGHLTCGIIMKMYRLTNLKGLLVRVVVE